MDAYRKTLDYLYETLPMFQRIGAVAYKDNLDNTIALCKALGNPERKFRSIHVAGTNGKGSTIAFMRAVLEAAGLAVHVYTSPHLVRFNERFRLGSKVRNGSEGRLASDEELAAVLQVLQREASNLAAVAGDLYPRCTPADLAAVFAVSGTAKLTMTRERLLDTGQTGVAMFPMPVVRFTASMEAETSMSVSSSFSCFT